MLSSELLVEIRKLRILLSITAGLLVKPELPEYQRKD